MSELIINNLKVGLNNRPLIIAEMSGNHNQSLERALEIVEAAAKSGAHALKLQTYKADTITGKEPMKKRSCDFRNSILSTLTNCVSESSSR